MSSETSAPPYVDHGYAWVILAAGFGMQLLTIGAAKSFGILYAELLDTFQMSAASTAWILSVNMGVLNATGIISSSLAEAFTYRLVFILCGVLSALGFVCSSFVTKMEVLYVTYGLITGFGFGLAYAPTIIMVSMYFDKRNALANGIVVCGSGMGNFIWPFLYRVLLAEYSLFGIWLIAGAVCLNVCVLGALMRPFPGNQRMEEIVAENVSGNPDAIEQDPENASKSKIQTCRTMCMKLIPDYTYLSDPIFWVYMVSFSFAMVGYTSNIAVIPPLAESRGISLDSVATIISINGLADLCGRVVLGWLADIQFLTRRYIFALSTVFSGMAAFLATFATTFTTVGLYAAWSGFFGSSLWSMVAVLLSDAFGKNTLPTVIGLTLTILSLPSIAGPLFYGWLKDMTGDWRFSLTMTGVFMLLSSICVMLEPIVRRFSAGRYTRI